MNHAHFLSMVTKSMPWLIFASYTCIALFIGIHLGSSAGWMLAAFFLIFGWIIFIVTTNQNEKNYDGASLIHTFVFIFSIALVVIGFLLIFFLFQFYVGGFIYFCGMAGISWVERRFV
ncbi:MAG: hypothetical protein AAGA73_02440 [Pseudomonadota bacterium]